MTTRKKRPFYPLSASARTALGRLIHALVDTGEPLREHLARRGITDGRRYHLTFNQLRGIGAGPSEPLLRLVRYFGGPTVAAAINRRLAQMEAPYRVAIQYNAETPELSLLDVHCVFHTAPPSAWQARHGPKGTLEDVWAVPPFTTVCVPLEAHGDPAD